VISVVDPDARHGHKTAVRKFDGYKGHISVDPDSEVITATVVTPGNAGDASVAAELIDDLVGDDDRTDDDGPGPKVYGDNAYGTGEFQSKLEAKGIASGARRSRPPRRATYSPRTASISTSGPAPSPVPTMSPSSSATRATVRAWPGSANRAPAARYGIAAQLPSAGGPSGPGLTKGHWPAPGTVKKARPGPLTTGPPAQRSNASSATSCAAVTAGGEHEYAARRKVTIQVAGRAERAKIHHSGPTIG
jgi:hypothetical protein